MNRHCLGLLIISLVLFFNTSVAQWTTVPLGTTATLYNVKYFGATDIWIPGNLGLVKSTNNGGSFFTTPLAMSSGLSWNGSWLYDVAITSSQEAVGAGRFLLGNAEVIVHTTNGGVYWDSTHLFTGTLNAFMRTAEFPTPTTCYIAGWQGRVFRSTTSGTTWSTVYTNPAVTFYDMFFSSGTQGVVGGEGGIIRTTNGTTFNQVLSITGEIKGIDFAGSTGYAVGNSGGGSIFKSTDDGLTWIPIASPEADVVSVSAISEDTVIIASMFMLYKSVDGGVFWEQFVMPPGIVYSMNDVKFRDSNTGYAVGTNGYCIRTTNGGGQTIPVSSFNVTGSTFCQNSSYTFTNNCNPAYTFQWLVNGIPVSTSYDLNYTFTNAGITTVSLVAFNGLGYDTHTESINVQQTVVNPITIVTNPVCPGTLATVQVLNSQNGVQYQPRNGFAILSAIQWGNGGTLTFVFSSPNSTALYNVKSVLSNSCGVDSSTTTFQQVVFPDLATPATTTDSLLCSSAESFYVDVQNSQIGITYTLKQGLTTYDSLQGNGGTITLQAPPQTGTGSRVFRVYAYASATCNPLLRSFTTLVDTTYAVINTTVPSLWPGDTTSFQNFSFGADFNNWTFPPQASIQSSTLANPEITFSTPGVYEATLIVSNVQGCTDTTRDRIYVNAMSTAMATGYCGNTEMNPSNLMPIDGIVDAGKNIYITGHYWYDAMPFRGMFVSKIDSLGELKWFKQIDTQGHVVGNSAGTGITVDESGNVYVSLSYTGTRLFLDTFLLPVDSITGIYGCVAKFDSTGNVTWVVRSAPPDNQSFGFWISDIERGSNGKLYVTGGHNNGTVQFADGFIMTATGPAGSAYLLTIDTAGMFVDYQSFGPVSGGNLHPGMLYPITKHISPRIQELHNGTIAVDMMVKPTAGNLQSTFGTFNFNDTTTAIYSVFFDTSGTCTNAFRGPSGGMVWFRDALHDTLDNSYYTYQAERQLIMGSAITNLDYRAGFGTYYPYYCITSFNASGTLNWSHNNRFAKITGIDLNPSGELLFSAIVLENGALMTASGVPQGFQYFGVNDGVYGKYDTQGNLLFANSNGGAINDAALDVISGHCNDIIVPSVESLNNPAGWPGSDVPGQPGSFSVYRYSEDGFCNSDINCTGVNLFTLTDDAALIRLILGDTITSMTNLPVAVRLKSFGTNSLQSAQIVLQVNGLTQLTFPWTGGLQQFAAIDSLYLGLLAFPVSGSYQIKAWVEQPNGTADLNNTNDTVYATVTSTTGLHEIGNGMQIYPNPVSGMVHILLPGGANGFIRVSDITGRKLEEIYVTGNESKLSLDLSRLTSGVYLINYDSGSGRVVHRIVKE